MEGEFSPLKCQVEKDEEDSSGISGFVVSPAVLGDAACEAGSGEETAK